MNKVRQHGGFTLLESMIVMAVTGLLLFMAVTFVQGRFSSNAFQTSVREFDAKVQDVINDVTTGTLVDLLKGNDPYKYCWAVRGSAVQSPTFLTVPAPTNAASLSARSDNNCTYIGNAIQVGTQSASCTTASPKDCSNYTVYPLVGRRTTPASANLFVEVTSLDKALAVPLYTRPDYSELKSLGPSLTATKVVADTNNDNVWETYAALAFTTTFGRVPTKTSDINAAQIANIIAIPGSQMGQTKTIAAMNIYNKLKTFGPNDPRISPSKGVTICLQGPGKHNAQITVGDSARTVLTTTTIDVDFTRDPRCKP
jgi:prepilin-type N-terminal cleavage/methylation domain-containing protein